MPVALGQVSRNIYDAAGALLQNKQIETQERIARAQIRAANQRAALGAAENALGMLNANNQRAQDRQLQQQRDAQQQRAIEQQRRASRLQQLLDAINKENERWLREVDRMRQRGFMHSPDQEQSLAEIDRRHDELVDAINKAIKDGDTNVAEGIAQQLLTEQQKRWKFVPRTEIPPEFKEVDGQKMMRDANGNWREIRNLEAERAEKIKRDDQAHADRQAGIKRQAMNDARDAFNDTYQTGGTYNEALDAKNEVLTSNGLPPSTARRKTPDEPGYYFQDPKQASNAQKRFDSEEKYLRGRHDKIMDSLRDKKDDIGGPYQWKPGEKQAEFDKIWKDEGYRDLEQRLQQQREATATNAPGVAAPVSSQNEIPQEVLEAKAFLDNVAQYLQRGGKSSRAMTQQVQSANNLLKDYEGKNPGRLSSLPSAAPRGTQAAQPPVATPQQVPIPQQVPAPPAPQAAQPPAAEPATPSGPFKRGNFLNGPRAPQTSSLGGGGLGVLASAPVPASILNALSGSSSSAATTQTEPASSESNVRDGVTYDPDFLRAWDAKYPGQPITASTSREFQSARRLAQHQKDLRARAAQTPQTPPTYPLVRTPDDFQNLKPGSLYREMDGSVMQYEGKNADGSHQSRSTDKRVASEPRGQSVGKNYQPDFIDQSLQLGMKPFRESGSTSRVSPEDSRIDQAYENAQGLGLTKFDGDDRWMRMTTTPGVDYSSRWEPVPESEVERLKSQGAGGVEFKEEKFDRSTRGVGGTELAPVKPEGYDERFQARVNQARLQAGNTPLLPDSESGPASLGRQAQAEKDQADWKKQVDEAVKFYGLSGNGEHPKTADGEPASEAATFTARTKTTQLNDTMQQLDAKGELPPSLLEFPDKFPAWVTRLPAASWKDKDGKEHHRNDVPTDEEGLQNLINEISKSKQIGKYSPEAKAAAKAAEQGEQPASNATDDASSLPISASPFSPEMQEYHLRTPKPPSQEAFEQRIRDQGLNPLPGEYDDFLKAREQVRNQLPKSADRTAPGNLFLDKDGTLKQNDGKGGSPYPKDQPLPPGYNQLVPQPGRQPLQGQQPQRGQPQAAPPRELQPLDIARGAAAARRNQAAEDARSPRQQALDRLDRAKQQEIRDFFQPPPIQQRIAPRPLDRKDFQVPPLGVPAGAGIQGRASFTPTFDDFSSQGQFPQQQFPSLGLGSVQPDYNNAIASSGFSPEYLPSTQSFQPTYQPQYAQPSFDQPFTYYEAPQYEQPYFQPQFDNFSNYQFQPQFEPVNYPSFSFDPYVGGLGNVYSVGGGGDFYGGGYSDGLSYFGDIA